MNGHDKVADGLRDFSVDDLWELRNIAQPGVGTITIHTSVRVDGTVRESVPRKFFSSVLTSFRGQPMPVEFEIPATDLAGAIANWRSTAEKAAQDAVERMETQLTRQRLVMPGAAAGPLSRKVN